MGKKATSPTNNTPLHKIIMLGPGGVGKSALTLQYMYGDFVSEYDPTKADSYRKKTTVNGKEVFIDILDTAGQEEYAAIRDNYYRSGEGFICVYSVLEREGFEEMKEFREQICRVLDTEDFPFVLVANKCDMPGRIISTQEGEKIAKQWNCTYIETSAKTKLNVEECFQAVMKLVAQKKELAAEKENGAKQKQKQKKKCIIL